MDQTLYFEDIRKISSLNLDWGQFQNSSILITGATGLIGTVIVDLLMFKNENENLNCKIFALTRNSKKAQEQFNQYKTSDLLTFIEHNFESPLESISENVDFVFHLASNTHPVAYATDPIGTISTNIIGTKNLLDFACSHNVKRFVFMSSCEVYGENTTDKEYFSESDFGYIDCNTLRAGYCESKRCGEALCQAYIKQKQLDIVIPRLCRIYGPTIKTDDSKAISQFIKKALNNENIVLKSEGKQHYSFLYVFDAVSAIFTILFNGKNGEAYNVSDKSCDITLRKLAELIAKQVNKQVIFELPSETEKAGFSKATKALLDSSKLQSLRWKPCFGLETSIQRTIAMLKG